MSRTKKSLKSKKINKLSKIKRIDSIKKKVDRKYVRKITLERVSKIIDVIPKFVKFYKKLSTSDIRAIKYYKGNGSRWQTQLLTTNKIKELNVPFSFNEEKRFRKDIIGDNADKLLPMLKSLDIKDLDTYIRNSINARITLLNRLDTIFQKKDCPKLKGDEILFRGTTMFPELKNKKEGETILFKNFISTTIDRNIAEKYSENQVLFILTNLKDVPFIYIPNSKKYKESFATFTVEQNPDNDFSEFTLPRNLEFTINKIDDEYVTFFDSFYKRKSSNYKSIIKTLKNKGYFNENNNQKNNTVLKEDKNETIEEKIYPKFKVYYCSFKEQHKTEPIIYNNIIKGVKFVLNKNAIMSWSNTFYYNNNNN